MREEWKEVQDREVQGLGQSGLAVKHMGSILEGLGRARERRKLSRSLTRG